MINAAPAPLTQPGAAATGTATAGQAPGATDAEAERFQRLLEQADPRRHGADKAARTRASGSSGTSPDKLPGHAKAPTEDPPTDSPTPAAAHAEDPLPAPSTDLSAMLAALQAQPLPGPQAGPRPAGDKFTAATEAARGTTARGAHRPAGTAAEVAGPTAPPAASATPDFADTLALQAATEPRTQQPEAAPRAAEASPPLPPALAAPPATMMSASAPAEARIAASPGSPDFASQLGAQLSTFVREGVQHARLELHPLELGPVTVQIQLDGNQAQVNLSAELGDTRQALEQALPQLAGSLREAGLMLAGGGVFEQPRQAPQGNPTRDTRRNPPLVDEEPGVRDIAVPALRRRGVVDLVA